jgi:hypothetical protein
MRFSDRRIYAAIVLAALFLTACGGGAPETGESGEYDPSVLVLPADQAQPYLQIPSQEGVLPCGVFDVQGHGAKVATLSDYPSCAAADYRVLCLNGEAQWNSDFVSNKKVHTNAGTIEFTSSQEGICAIFPEP